MYSPWNAPHHFASSPAAQSFHQRDEMIMDMEMDSDGDCTTDELNRSGSYSDDDAMDFEFTDVLCEPRFSLDPRLSDADLLTCGYQASPSRPVPCLANLVSPHLEDFSPSSYPNSPMGQPIRKRKKARSLPPPAPDTPSLVGIPNIPTPDIAGFGTSNMRQRLTRRPSNLDLPPPTPKKHSGQSRLPLSNIRTPVPIHTPENFSHATPNLSDEQREQYFETAFTNRQLIGEGSYSKVYKALRLSDRQWFAIKVSKKPFSGVKSKVKAVKELQIVKNFKHPHVLQYIFAWEHNETMYIQTELCTQSLSGFMTDTLKRCEDTGDTNTPYFDESLLWSFLTDILLGLHHIHHANFLHLDIKPGNILFDRSGRLKIADFGLALSVEEAQTEDVPEGDSRYLAPELLDNALQENFVVDRSADIFSLGATMFELATLLEMPKEGTEWTQLRQGNLKELMGLHYSSALKRIIATMMEPNPDNRPTVDDLVANKYVMQVIKERKENCREMAYLQALEEASGGPRVNVAPTTPLVHASLCTQSAGPRLGTRTFNHAGRGPRKNLTARFAAFG